MRLCTLTSSYRNSTSPFAKYDSRLDPSRWLPEHQWTAVEIEKATAVRQVQALCRQDLDVIVNLCDGSRDEDRAGVEVIETLERMGVAFTGSDSHFYEPSREVMKRTCHYLDIGTPRYAFIRSQEQALALAQTLRFPMIVKHPSSYGSIGMYRDARVTCAAELADRVERMSAQFGEALVEEFVDGREFTVLVAEPRPGSSEPRTWQPIEVLFPEGESFKHFELKWAEHERLRSIPVTDDALAAALVDASRELFVGMKGSGYGRCDLRLDADGRVNVLELNDNCSVFYPPGQEGSADFILGHHDDGHRDFLDHIIALALARRERLRPRWQVRYRPASDDYGMIATMDIAAGEMIEAYETRPQHIVSRTHVERRFSAIEKRWFARYAWPLTDDLFAMWSDRAEDWKPLNHSCDPNAWLEGLDLVARRDIRVNESITVDYATFCGPTMRPFQCDCGTALCRGTVHPDDHLAAWVTDRYGDHVSDYVRRARRGP